MRPLIPAAAAALSILPLPAAAGDGKLAAEVARLMQPPEVFRKTLDEQFGAIEQMMGMTGGRLGPDQMKAVREEIDGLVPYAWMIGLHAEMLAKYYSDKELRDLAAFYRSPLGRKVIEVQPRMGRDVATAMQTRMMSELPKMMQRLQQRIGPAMGPGMGGPQMPPLTPGN